MSTPYSSGFDAHTHLDFPAFDLDRAEVCARARGAGVQSWIIAAANPCHWTRVLKIAHETNGFAVLGIHPWWVEELTAESLKAYLNQLKELHTPWGIGEIGLDYYRSESKEIRRQQRHVFREQLALARELELPVIIHCVRAYPDLFTLIQQDGLSSRGGMIHGWSGSKELGQQALKLGLMLSFNSLFLRSPKVALTLKNLPLDALLLETDSPDQCIEVGRRNEPSELIKLAENIATFRPESADMLLHSSSLNAAKLFGLRS
jgi:TatD DNase family protein